MRIPKSLIIGGVRWKIVYDKKLSGGAFFWREHIIKLNPDDSLERKYHNLLHEICEVILVNYNLRYSKPTMEQANGDYLFVLDHDRFEMFIQELGGILKQWFPNRGI